MGLGAPCGSAESQQTKMRACEGGPVTREDEAGGEVPARLVVAVRTEAADDAFKQGGLAAHATADRW